MDGIHRIQSRLLIIYAFLWYLANWEGHPEVSNMIELQKGGMTSSRPAGEDEVSHGEGQGEPILAASQAQDSKAHVQQVPASSGNKFQLLMGFSDDND